MNIRLSDENHLRLRRLATESGLTNARVVELALEFYERECGAALRQMRQGGPVVDAVFTDDRKLEVEVTMTTDPFEGKTPEEITSTAVEVIKEQLIEHGLVPAVTPPETSAQGQPAPSAAADDDSWWRDL
jgi:hypothetical protein